jgi:hypothetical protein
MNVFSRLTAVVPPLTFEQQANNKKERITSHIAIFSSLLAMA